MHIFVVYLPLQYKTEFRFGHGDVYFCCLMSLDENGDEEEQKINFDPLEIAALSMDVT